MNKIFLQLTLLLFTVTFAACSKMPFKEQTPLLDSALVYIYVSEDESINETYINPSYEITLNSEKIKDSIKINEYISFHLKPQNLTATATRSDIESQDLELQLEAGKAYFLRVRSFSDDFGKFKFVVVDNNMALNEIKDAALATEIEKKEEFINSLIKQEDSNKNPSKTDEIKKAYKLKTDGVITDEEFKKLKAEILAN